MPDSDSNDFSGRMRIDAVCDAFENSWKNRGESGRPDLREFLARVADKHRPRLATELILIDRHYAGLVGGSVRREDYLAKYPELENAISRAFAADQGTIDSAATQPLGDLPTIDSASLEPNPAIDRIGQTVRYFGDYELIEEIARGGMGVVYRARQISLNREIALKMILSGQIAGEDQIRRFQLEAEAAANLDHPGIVPIYDIGQHDGQHYFSMKLIEGQTLSQVASTLTDDHDRIAELVVQIADAVHHAHQRGILHRDLKPGNVLIDDDGTPLITDFGLARDTKSDQQNTASGAVIGTPGFMSPEQAAGKGVTTATDIYSLGAILYQLLCGRPPHQGDSVMATLMSVMNDPPTKPRSINANIHRDLELICLKCLDKDPNERYASAAEFAGDLRAFQAGQPLRVRPPSIIELAHIWLAGNYGSLVWVPIIAGVIGVVSGLSLWLATLGHSLSKSTWTYDYFQESERPFLALDSSDFVKGIAGSVFLLTTSIIGWVTAKLVRTRTTAADIGAGLSVGLIAGLIAFVAGAGLPVIAVMSSRSDADLELLGKVGTYQNTMTAHAEIIHRYGTLKPMSDQFRADVLLNKLRIERWTDTLRGIWVGTLVLSVWYGLSGITQTWIAGKLVRERSWISGLLQYAIFTIAFVAILYTIVQELFARMVIGEGVIFSWTLPVLTVLFCSLAIFSVVWRWKLLGQLPVFVLGLLAFFMHFVAINQIGPDLPARRAAITKAKEMVALDPTNRNYAVRLAAAHADCGDLLEKRGRDEAMLVEYEDAFAILKSRFFDEQKIGEKGQWNQVEINLYARVLNRIAQVAMRLGMSERREQSLDRWRTGPC